jgi:hypothetical protein
LSGLASRRAWSGQLTEPSAVPSRPITVLPAAPASAGSMLEQGRRRLHPARVHRPQQGQAAQRDPGQDGRAAGRLGQPDRVAEGGGAGGRADQRLQVDEGAGDLGRDPGLPVGEEGGRRQRARERQPGGGQQGGRAGGEGGEGLGGGGHGEGGEGGREELQGGHGDRVAAGEQAGLGHGEGGRQHQGGQDQGVAGEAGPAAPDGGDQADAGERHRGPRPGHRLGQPAVPEGGEDGDEHGGGPDEQARVAHAELPAWSGSPRRPRCTASAG